MSRRGWVMFISMCVIWGIPYLLIKVAVTGVSVPVLVLARVGIGAALLLPLAVRSRQLRVLLPYWRWLALFAVIEIALPWLLLSQAETKLSSSLTGLLIASVPILVVVIARFTGAAERMSAVRWTGLLVGLAGVGVLVGPGANGSDALSIAEVFGVALCYAIGPLIANRKLSSLPPLGMTAVCLAFAAVLYSPLAALDWPSAVPSFRVLASLAGLAVICTAVAFLVFFRLIAEIGPARATVITYVNPAVAVALGVSILGEPFTLAMAGAFALILGGSVLATRGPRPAAAKDQPAVAAAGPAAGAGEVLPDAPEPAR